MLKYAVLPSQPAHTDPLQRCYESCSCPLRHQGLWPLLSPHTLILPQLSQSSPSSQYTYGWHRAEILAALVNGVFLLALCFSIFMEAIEKFINVPG
jgi:hypothetical protein